MPEPPARSRSSRPGPRRRENEPAGPEEVRRALLDAAADLFAKEGVTEVSLREVAAEADVQHALIARYIGHREALIRAVFDDLTAALAKEVMDRPLESMSFERDSVMGRWTILLAHFAVTEPDKLPMSTDFNPMLALAEVLAESYGQDARSARLRGAQIVASALGWRIFERYLIAGSQLDIEVDVLREELTAMHRRLGATSWPSPPDPTPRSRADG